MIHLVRKNETERWKVLPLAPEEDILIVLGVGRLGKGIKEFEGGLHFYDFVITSRPMHTAVRGVIESI